MNATAEVMPVREDDVSMAHLPKWIAAGYNEADVRMFLEGEAALRAEGLRARVRACYDALLPAWCSLCGHDQEL